MAEAILSQLLQDLLSFSSVGKGDLDGLTERVSYFVNNYDLLSQDISKKTEFENVAYFIFQSMLKIMDLKKLHSNLNEINISTSIKTNRTSYTEDQKNILNKWFECHRSNPFPDTQELIFLTEITGLSNIQIKDWFKNARRRK